MKFLLDQDVYASTMRFLRDLGHDVIPVAQVGLSQASDEQLLRIAQEQNRVFVTRFFLDPTVGFEYNGSQAKH